MFEGFFNQLRSHGLPVSPKSFMQLQQALDAGLVDDLEDFYAVARALLVKSERHFDLYDRVFATWFEGKEFVDPSGALTEDLRRTLAEWLRDPEFLAGLPDDEKEALAGMTPDEVAQYFLDRLKDQSEAHHGGNRWIGTGGTSPVGHGGVHPGGMRVGGGPGRSSAIKVAMDRRYVDYSEDRILSERQMAEALRALRHRAPVGPKDRLDIDASIRETVRQGGEIELVFDRRLKDKLSVFLFIDNGGYSMWPYVTMTRALFHHARDSFRRLRTFFFHNCVYDTVWEDPRRVDKPVPLQDVLRADSDTRVILLGDAAMAPYELLHRRGSIDFTSIQERPGIECLHDLRARFPKSVWLNPAPRERWDWSMGTFTIDHIRKVFPMEDLTLPGIERLVSHLS